MQSLKGPIYFKSNQRLNGCDITLNKICPKQRHFRVSLGDSNSLASRKLHKPMKFVLVCAVELPVIISECSMYVH